MTFVAVARSLCLRNIRRGPREFFPICPDGPTQFPFTTKLELQIADGYPTFDGLAVCDSANHGFRNEVCR